MVEATREYYLERVRELELEKAALLLKVAELEKKYPLGKDWA